MPPKAVLLLIAVAAAAADFAEDFDVEDELGLPQNEDEVEAYFTRSFRAAMSAAAPNVCTGGSVALESNDPAPCIVTDGKKNKMAKILKSPADNSGTCNVEFDSEAPGYMRAKMFKSALSDSDVLEYTGAFGDKIRLTKDDVDKKLVLPTTFGSIKYVGSSGRSMAERKKKPARDFMLFALPMSNNCQRTIDAPAGTGGRLIFPGFDTRNYTADTMCQWWIKAPEGQKIVLKFNSFNVGSDVTDCEGSDYIGVDKAGDPTYETSPVKFCGNTIPEDVTSDANLINVLGFGRAGGRGFCCTYDVIDA